MEVTACSVVVPVTSTAPPTAVRGAHDRVVRWFFCPISHGTTALRKNSAEGLGVAETGGRCLYFAQGLPRGSTSYRTPCPRRRQFSAGLSMSPKKRRWGSRRTSLRTGR
eukprot:3323471-Pyramimonas_sp.AAC.1